MALQKLTVSAGDSFDFHIGDIIQIRLADNETYIDGTNVYTLPKDTFAKGAIVDASADSIECRTPKLTADNSSETLVIKLEVTTAPVHIMPSSYDALVVDPYNIEVLRNEVISAKNKIVVTKEKLAYYHNKIKSLLNAKGTVKKVNYAGIDYMPDANGVIILPDGIPDMSHDNTNQRLYLKYYSKDDPAQTTFDENQLVFDHGASTDGMTINLIKAGTQSFSVLLPNKSYVDDKAAACSTLKFQKVDTLPDAATAEDGIIYLIENTSAGANVYDEYFRVNKGDSTTPNYVLELFGTTAVDLADYLQETDITEITNAEIDEIVA